MPIACCLFRTEIQTIARSTEWCRSPSACAKTAALARNAPSKVASAAKRFKASVGSRIRNSRLNPLNYEVEFEHGKLGMNRLPVRFRVAPKTVAGSGGTANSAQYAKLKECYRQAEK